jgi:acyl CoA:acetate/3-ketoacid CoA transferase
VLAQARIELKIAPEVKTMDARLFRPEPMGLALAPRRPDKSER